MGVPFKLPYTTGFTIAATLTRRDNGQEWRHNTTAGWESAGTSSFDNRKVPLTEGTTSKVGFYESAEENGLGDAGWVDILFHNDGAADQVIQYGEVYIWGGEEVDPPASSVTGDVIGSVASVVGNVGGSIVGDLGGDVIGSVAGDLLGDVVGTVAAVLGTVGSVTGNVGGNVVGSVASVTDPVTVGTLTANVITASALATDAVAEIASAISALQFTRTGTAQAGGASTITLDAGASATDDIYIGLSLRIVSGTGLGQTRPISDYVGATKVATVGVAWDTEPDSTSVFVIEPSQVVTLAADAFDAIVIEAGGDGLNFIGAMQLCAAAAAGKVTGAGTTTVTIYAAGDPGTARIVGTVDRLGNRSSLVLTVSA